MHHRSENFYCAIIFSVRYSQVGIGKYMDNGTNSLIGQLMIIRLKPIIQWLQLLVHSVIYINA